MWLLRATYAYLCMAALLVALDGVHLRAASWCKAQALWQGSVMT